ncbi:dephospho-CoA kinase [Pelagibacteraceae bacterium]|nr:dephospho-CoA kinase [Pelagibacteraceae bacterium]
MTKIGVTGLLASGKSTVSKFITRNKYPLFSADLSVKSLYNNRSFIKKIKNKFKLKSSLNIKKNISKVIKNDKKKLKEIESIIHPFVRKDMRFFLKKNKNKKIIVLEIPLLIESKLMKYFDIIIFVNSSKKIRLKRYLKKKGSIKMFKLLSNNQKSRRVKSKHSDYTIQNNTSLKKLKKDVKMIINKYE